MGELLTTLDLVIFFGTLAGVMAVGLIAGRKEETSQDYFLAGRNIPWWGVAGSIFGSNVSANHLVGMLGVGYSVGFAQSHFELGAIAGLMLLCYGFLPVYRRMRVYTLSEYLGRRYGEAPRLVYALIMVLIMVLVQMVPGFYIGSRAMNQLLEGTSIAPGYQWGIVLLAGVAAAYTIQGGLKAVVWTDVMQSFLLLAAGIGVAVATFARIGGFGAMVAVDAALPAAEQKMHLYLPTDHPELPWTGVFTGLMFLHFFYWGTNQFIVQRALGARSDADARLGIVAAGFFKLLIPFFAIATGIAAAQLFARELPDKTVDPDVAFPELVKLVVPIGWGMVGVISAGLIGAILSSIDSMMNSAATIVTIDVYQRYFDPDASDRTLINVGRLSIAVFVTIAALVAIFVLDPNSKKNFFLTIADYQGHLIPGLLVAFAMGMFWRRTTATAALVTMIAGAVFSVVFELFYNKYLGSTDAVAGVFGAQLNFLHRTAVAVLFAAVLCWALSLVTSGDPEKSKLVWTDLGGHRPETLRRGVTVIAAALGGFAVLGGLVISEGLRPAAAGGIAAAVTLALFVAVAVRRSRGPEAIPQEEGDRGAKPLWADDLLWAGVLCGLAMFMLYYYV